MHKNAPFFFIIFTASAIMASALHAQTISQTQGIRFGNLVVPGPGAVIQIEADGMVSTGSGLILTPPNPSAGRYRITGSAGTVDISVSGVSSCEAGVMFDRFSALWNSVAYADISTTPITGAAFDGDEFLDLGARISYGGDVTIGSCANSFDINVTYY